MIQNIQKYAAQRGIGVQDALQVFMQVVALKNIRLEGVALIGGTALVLAENNPRFSEDIDLAGLKDPKKIMPDLKRASAELEAFLEGQVLVKPPKAGKVTWKISCHAQNLTATLHIDSQGFRPLTKRPLMVEFPGVPAFIFPSVALEEIMADKLLALAFRNNLSGRDIFDLWYHWFRHGFEGESKVAQLLKEKLAQRKIAAGAFNGTIASRLKGAIPERVVDEWNRYLPAGLKNNALYEDIFAISKKHLNEVKL